MLFLITATEFVLEKAAATQVHNITLAERISGVSRLVFQIEARANQSN